MTPQEAAEQYATTKSYMDGKDIKGSAIATFIAGAQWQSEQDNQAISSVLKEIAELHAKMKDLKEGMCENCRIKQNLKLWANGDELESYTRPVMTSKNTYGFTSESSPESDSANLPPEVAS